MNPDCATISAPSALRSPSRLALPLARRVSFSDPVASYAASIRPAVKRKGGKKRMNIFQGPDENVFLDNRGYPDQSDYYDQLLHNIDGGDILRKRKHPPRALDDIDPRFNNAFDASLHNEKLRKELDISHLSPPQQQSLVTLIIKYWPVFDDRGLFIPVKDYECVIDTGDAKPIAVGNIHYGPRESPIMRKSIATLLQLGQIEQIHTGRWLFKALLAPKPHQEHICNIEDFVWRFCVNYIPLNSVTRLIAYPIPRCDAAVSLAFGDAQWFWLMDAPQGYHQIRVSNCSREKLAFAGPDAIKYTYNVMPFGPVNGPAIFITFIHDMNATWQLLAKERGIPIGDDNNTKIIVDDIWNHATTFEVALAYMECQFQVCLSQNLSLSLKKCHFFPKRIEFVGHDVSRDRNRPAQSKHQLLQTWPEPETVRCIASFVGFASFYSQYIPHFEIRVKRLREIMKLDYAELVTSHFDDDARAEWKDIQQALLADPCLLRFDHRKRVYLRTDFSARGFGFVVL